MDEVKKLIKLLKNNGPECQYRLKSLVNTLDNIKCIEILNSDKIYDENYLFVDFAIYPENGNSSIEIGTVFLNSIITNDNDMDESIVTIAAVVLENELCFNFNFNKDN